MDLTRAVQKLHKLQPLAPYTSYFLPSYPALPLIAEVVHCLVLQPAHSTSVNGRQPAAKIFFPVLPLLRRALECILLGAPAYLMLHHTAGTERWPAAQQQPRPPCWGQSREFCISSHLKSG